MNRFKCPVCGGNQYTACDTAEGCIYCGNKELKKMNKLEPEEEWGVKGKQIIFLAARIEKKKRFEKVFEEGWTVIDISKEDFESLWKLISCESTLPFIMARGIVIKNS